MADSEIEHIQAQRETTRRRLRIIEQQIAQFGEKWAPPHLITERAESREKLNKYETVLTSATPIEVGDDLSEKGRFILYLEEFKTVKEMVALYGYQLGEFIQETSEYRSRHAIEHARDRRWIIGGAIALIVIAAFVLGRLI